MPEKLMKEAAAERPPCDSSRTTGAQTRTASDTPEPNGAASGCKPSPENGAMSEAHRANRGIPAGALLHTSESS